MARKSISHPQQKIIPHFVLLSEIDAQCLVALEFAEGERFGGIPSLAIAAMREDRQERDEDDG